MRLDKDQLKVLAVLIVVVTGFSIGIWMPARDQRQAIQQRIDRAKKRLDTARDSPSLKQWHQRVASLKDRVASSRQRVPSQDELAKVLRGLGQVLGERGVDGPEVSTAETERFGTFGVTPITVKFTGSFPDAHAVVRRIEQMPRLIQVDRFEVVRDEVTAEAPLRVLIELSAFFSTKEQAP